MRRAAKVDRNQEEIVVVLRRVGCTVQSLATIGQGCPDLLVGYRGKNFLLEVKDGEKSPSARALTADEHLWHDRWQGEVCVVNSAYEALAAIIGAKAASFINKHGLM
jgi:hypothetical protein